MNALRFRNMDNSWVDLPKHDEKVQAARSTNEAETKTTVSETSTAMDKKTAQQHQSEEHKLEFNAIAALSQDHHNESPRVNNQNGSSNMAILLGSVLGFA